MSNKSLIRLVVILVVIVGLLALIPAPGNIEQNSAEAARTGAGGDGQSLLDWINFNVRGTISHF